MSDVIYPIAETFYSLQGEGTFTGLPMSFIRFAGCCVGQPLEKTHSLFPQYTRCTPVAGPSFVCDTDYRTYTTKSIEELVAWAKTQPAKTVCLTGGEPLIHDLSPLVQRLSLAGYKVHLETSGTKSIPEIGLDWVACAPKRGFVPGNRRKMDELKFLVAHNTPLEEIDTFLLGELEWSQEELDNPRTPVFLQPVNDLHGVSRYSLDRVLEMLASRPRWQLSVQLHKLLGWR